MEGEVISLQDIFIYDRHGIAEDGHVLGQFVPTGIRPRFADQCLKFGIQIPDFYFMPPKTSRFQRPQRKSFEMGTYQ